MGTRTQALLAIAALLAGVQAHAADKAGCAKPEWAPAPLPGYEIDDCDERPWDSVQLDTDKEPVDVQGRKREVDYALRDEKKNVSSVKARDYYAEQAKKAGAELVHQDGWSTILRRKGAGGESWYVYRHGSGNEADTGSYTITTIDVTPLPQEVETRAMPGPLEPPKGACGNPPWVVKQLAAYKPDPSGCEFKAWDMKRLELTDGEHLVMGRRLLVSYTLPDEKKVIVPREATLDYVAALEKSGAQILRGAKEKDGAVVATQKTRDGEFWYVWEQSGGNGGSLAGYYLTTWEVTPLDQEVEAKLYEGPVDTKGCKDPPWLVKQFPFFKRGDCSNRDFDTVTYDTTEGEKKMAGTRPRGGLRPHGPAQGSGRLRGREELRERAGEDRREAGLRPERHLYRGPHAEDRARRAHVHLQARLRQRGLHGLVLAGHGASRGAAAEAVQARDLRGQLRLRQGDAQARLGAGAERGARDLQGGPEVRRRAERPYRQRRQARLQHEAFGRARCGREGLARRARRGRRAPAYRGLRRHASAGSEHERREPGEEPARGARGGTTAPAAE